MVMKIM